MGPVSTMVITGGSAVRPYGRTVSKALYREAETTHRFDGSDGVGDDHYWPSCRAIQASRVLLRAHSTEPIRKCGMCVRASPVR